MNKEDFEHEVDEIKKEVKEELSWLSGDAFDIEFKPDVVMYFHWYSSVISLKDLEVISRIFEEHEYETDYISIESYDGKVRTSDDCYLLVKFIKFHRSQAANTGSLWGL